jgi:hypothetical protein
MDDETLADALARRSPVPYPGRWLSPPFQERIVGDRILALVAVDDGLSAIGVSRSDGAVWLLPDDGEPGLVNTTIDALVACSVAYAEAAAEAARLAAEGFSDGDPDEAEDRGDELTDAVLDRFARIDPAGVADENSLWSVAAEELGYTIPS